MSDKTKAEALRRIRDGGPAAWCEGKSRAGGAVSRLFDAMTKDGLCTRAPHVVTLKGAKWLAEYAAQHPPRCLHCKKVRSDHAHRTAACPIGARHRSVGYTQYALSTVFYSQEKT